MQRLHERAVALIALLSLVGCTSLRVILDVTTPSPAPLSSLSLTLAPEDKLTLTKRNGDQVELRLTEVSAEALIGTVDNSPSKISVPLGDVARIERREFSGVKTAFLVIVIAAGVYAIAQAAGQGALAANI